MFFVVNGFHRKFTIKFGKATEGRAENKKLLMCHLLHINSFIVYMYSIFKYATLLYFSLIVFSVVESLGK